MGSSIRRDLSLSIGLVILCVSLLIGLVCYGFSVHFEKNKFNNDIQNQTKKLSDTFTLQLWLFDLNTTKKLCNLVFDSPEIIALRLLSHKKEILFEKGIFEDSSAIHISRKLLYENKTLVGYLDILYTDTVWKKQQNYILIVGACLVTGVIISSFLFINLLLKRYLSTPLDNLQRAMVAMADGDFPQSGMTEQKSEIQHIIDTFNNMAVRLRQRDKERRKAEDELKRYHDHLEELVAERTRELNETNKSLEQSREKAESANIAKSEFLSNMSHELRTPLNAILGFSQLMTRDSGITDEQRENLGIINRSGEHLLRLINDVLDMSKIETGRISSNPNDFDLLNMLASIEEMMRVRAEERALDFKVILTPGLPRHIRTDEGKLRQVLINLLGNAVKYTETGNIILRAWPGEKNNLFFEITDTGIGIAPDEMDTLFDAFVRTEHTEETTEGTGLGLAISRRFAHLMGGDITAESEVGKGSVFKFAIRAEPAEMAETEAEKTLPRIIGLEPDQQTYQILIAEDKWESRAFLSKLLQSAGFEIQEAVNGQEAIEMFEKQRPHLIFMDIKMPVLNGIEAARKIKATPDGKKIPVIALTASVFEENKSDILSAGCDDFIRKPVRETEIFESIKNYLKVRYIYEHPGAEENGVKIRTDLTPADLDILPAEWIAKFGETVLRGDEASITEMVEQIRTDHCVLAEALVKLVQDFRFDKLIALTDKAKGS